MGHSSIAPSGSLCLGLSCGAVSEATPLLILIKENAGTQAIASQRQLDHAHWLLALSKMAACGKTSHCWATTQMPGILNLMEDPVSEGAYEKGDLPKPGKQTPT